MDSDVSVIIPAYNSEDSIGRSIRSALEQSLRPLEIIVVDDGSTDGTAQVARSFEPDLKYLRQKNQGQGAARNAGLALARGEFIAFLDADDFWTPTFLENCVRFLHEHREAIAVSSGFVARRWGKPDYGWPPLGSGADEAPQEPRMIDDFFAFWARHDHIRTGTNVIRREVIEQAGGQNDRLRVSQDLEYWAYLGTFGRWGVLPERLFVTDGAGTAGQHGWIEKYRRRRKLCPSVEQWEERVAPRLTERDWPHFRVVRGRVASNFALNRILAGDPAAARQIVERFGEDMKPNRTNTALKLGHRLGAIGWKIACALVTGREHVKSALISATYRAGPASQTKTPSATAP